jgi:hypothetical protein
MKARTSLATVGVAAALATGGCLLALPASASGTTHTLKFTAVTQSQAAFGATGGASFDHDVNAANKVIGYDVVSFGHGNHGNVALALKAGFIYAHLTFAQSGDITGTLTGGTGKYAHVTGSVKGTQVTKKRAAVTLTYKL